MISLFRRALYSVHTMSEQQLTDDDDDTSRHTKKKCQLSIASVCVIYDSIVFSFHTRHHRCKKAQKIVARMISFSAQN